MNVDDSELIKRLKKKAVEIRINIVRMIGYNSGHAGGALSAVDVVTALYFHRMKHDPKNPYWRERDRFVLSKGHAAPLLYAVLAEAGYFDKKILLTLRKFKSPLQGHPDMRFKPGIPGIEISTGELGQGLSVACGISLASKVNNKNYRVYVLLGDGEIQEGQIWEAAMAASHHKMSNLTAIVDNNKLQIDGFVNEVMDIYPIVDKWKAFGWNAMEIDGHDMKQILDALKTAVEKKSKPTVIIANTIKGKGVSFWENNVASHHVHAGEISQEQMAQAINELNELKKRIDE